MPESRFTFSSSVRPVCEIGMSATREAEPTSWLDVSCYVHEAELFRGRERFNDRFEPGTASITFNNDSGWADFGSLYSEVAVAKLHPGRQIRIGVVGPWGGGPMTTHWLYRGFIDQATPHYDPVEHETVTINCIDALGEAGSSVAPDGPLQGVNEGGSLRINRILDALGWWPTKRKIDVTATKVQGTELGQAGIDLMGQAADSAGGVVFGDLDGDVVFRDLDWMLYDPNVPPDGAIGPGDPGARPVDHPPYLDPSRGAVYDPEDPPLEHPPKVCVCADGTAGTIVEKGDSYKLYVKNGHLYYQSGGKTWDMGPYSGGCTCVKHGDPPERTDPADPTIPPIPGVPVPPSFAVELLGWSDGGLADPPAASVSVSVTPGHDCLLVVLINAVGSPANATDLMPVIGGGGLDWAHRRDADQDHEGASGFVVLAAVGRTDPGTFPVTVTWATGMTTREHIVTVWKVIGAAADYLQRFDSGDVLYAVTESNPPDEIEPGNGPNIVNLHTATQQTGTHQNTRFTDITIAQSLAEEGTPPFGAILAESNGPWIYPPNDPAQPDVVALASVCDDFERADGPLGAGWISPPTVPTYGNAHAMSISSGAAVAPQDLSTAPGNEWGYARSATEVDGDQVVELTITQTSGGFQQFWDLNVRGNATNGACVQLYVEAANRFTGDWFLTLQTLDSTAHRDVVILDGVVGFVVTYPATLRLESLADGTLTASINGTTIATGTSTVAGTFVGFGSNWTAGSSAPIGTQPRVLAACVGGGRGRKTSWVAGWRQGAEYDTVELSDVNTGPTNIQSAQACLVLESGDTTNAWRLLGYAVEARPSGPPPAGTFAFGNAPRPGSLIVVMVGMTAATDLADSLGVTAAGVTFTRNVVQHKTGGSWGQGAVFTGVAPLNINPATWTLGVSYPACDTVSAVVYEVSGQAEVEPVGGTASGVLGNGNPGSVDGPSTMTLSVPADSLAVVLAYVHVTAPAAVGSGVTADPSVWTTEYASTVVERAYFQTMSRAAGGALSTSQSVSWTDVQTGTAQATSGVELAIEIHPVDGIVSTPGGFGVALGGLTDPWNGTISSAHAEDPETGELIWSFP